MKNKIELSKRTGKPIDTVAKQLIELPLAISKDGKPIKGSKSYATRTLEVRYKSGPVFSMHFPLTP